MRLAYVSCVRQLEEVKTAEYCDYIRPPIDKYGTLQFDAFDEIREVGYYHGKTYFAGLRKAGQLWFMSQPSLDRRRSMEILESPVKGVRGVARFTDLAEMVCRVRQVTPDRVEPGYSHDDDDDVYDDDDMELETDPDESEIVSDPEEYLEEGESSGFVSQQTEQDVLSPGGGVSLMIPGAGPHKRRSGSVPSSRDSASLVRRRHLDLEESD